MKIFYDTEFIDDGYTVDLVSIGMVSENGDEYYAVSAEFERGRFVLNSWLVDNVLPSLPFNIVEDEPTGAYKSTLILDTQHEDKWAVKFRGTIADEVSRFIKDHSTKNEAQLWAWYGSYDHVALAQLFGSMEDLPSWVPRFTHDLRQVISRLESQGIHSDVPSQVSNEHNALADAWQNFTIYKYLKEQYGIIE